MNMGDFMNLIQLRYFHAVCTYQTVSAAAARLHISQPSLSSAIAALEKEFNVELFQRRHYGMKLTPAGEQFLEMSKELLAHANQVERAMCALGQEKKRLRVGIAPMINSLFLPKIYDEFILQHPEIQMLISEGGRRVLHARLNDDIIDMFFLLHNAPPERDLVTMPIARMEVVCCVSKQHPLAGKETIVIQDLADVPLVMFRDSFFQTEEIKHRFELLGIEPNVVLQSEQFSTVSSILFGGVAVGFMFRELVPNNDLIETISLSDPLYVNISLAWKKGVDMTGAMKKFKTYMENMQLDGITSKM